MDTNDDEINSRYYIGPAAAFVRANLNITGGDDAALVRSGLEHRLPLHPFKRTSLPRVDKVIGILRGLMADSVLDIGTGRGVFLWPFLDAFGQDAKITCLDILPRRIDTILNVKAGGFRGVNAKIMNAEMLVFPDRSFDVVTALEVLEHLPRPEQACAEILRVARRFAVFSVPSKPDDNPEHIHLFDDGRIRDMLDAAGAASFKTEFVLNHRIFIAAVPATRGKSS